jgi:hypothetical protein
MPPNRGVGGFNETSTSIRSARRKSGELGNGDQEWRLLLDRTAAGLTSPPLLLAMRLLLGKTKAALRFVVLAEPWQQ